MLKITLEQFTLIQSLRLPSFGLIIALGILDSIRSPILGDILNSSSKFIKVIIVFHLVRLFVGDAESKSAEGSDIYISIDAVWIFKTHLYSVFLCPSGNFSFLDRSVIIRIAPAVTVLPVICWKSKIFNPVTFGNAYKIILETSLNYFDINIYLGFLTRNVFLSLGGFR
jgi:hypothetical protein